MSTINEAVFAIGKGVMMGTRALFFVKRSILLFWAAWLSVVVATNVLDGLQASGMLPETFKFVSGNWRWINQVMDPVGVPRGLQAVMFAGAIGWEALAATLFWRALATYSGGGMEREVETVQACGVNLALWAAFQVLDEVVLAYQPEAVHRMIFLNQVVTLLFLQLFRDAEGESRDDRVMG